MSAANTVSSIYDSLLLGNDVQIRFESIEAFRQFRTSISVYKHRNEKLSIELEVIEPKKLSSTFNYLTGIATFYFTDRSSEATQTFEVLSTTPHIEPTTPT